jgi:GWxTD domain-containing protein
MKNFLLCLLLVGFKTYAQPLQNINYNYLYDPQTPFSFTSQAVELNNDSIMVAYTLFINDTLLTRADAYTLSWELRESLSDKEGQAFFTADRPHRSNGVTSGNFSMLKSAVILCAKVVGLQQKKSWYFIVPTESSLLHFNVLVHSNVFITQKYSSLYTPLSFKKTSRNFISFYSLNFPIASPAFAETQTLVNPLLKPDSIFEVHDRFSPSVKGLYLAQPDTANLKGLAFRIEGDYPKFTSLQSLAEPLAYITTKSEFDRIKNSKEDKKVFDKTIVGIAGNTERAKIFMRNYFKRVEFANLYFTSYKEGWKTDRGMVYVIYGKPDFVYKFSDRELWEYETTNGKITFTFVLSSSVFDPTNFVLVRKKEYRDAWLAAVDLVRNAQF